MSRKDKRMDAIGLIETSSIARGYEIQDAMLKAADVTLMVARTICSGKYMIVVAGEVSAETSPATTIIYFPEQMVRATIKVTSAALSIAS